MTSSGSIALRIILCSSFAIMLFFASQALGDDTQTPHVVFIAGEHEYGSHETVPRIANELQERFGIKTTVIHSWMSGVRDPYHPGRSIPDFKAIPNLEVIHEADLMVLFIRFRIPPPDQFDLLQKYFDAGKPAVALRTTSHAFWHDDRKGWFVPFFGGHYKTHLGNVAGTTTMAMPDQISHPILRGVPKSEFLGYGGVYNTQPLNDTATPLMLGKTGDNPAEPIAWVNKYTENSRIFYTSMGSRANFENVGFRTMLFNAIFWALGKEIPANGVLGQGERESISFQAPVIPKPPRMKAPRKATVLFDGKDLSKWRHWDPSTDPKAIGIDERAVTTSGGPVYDKARWQIVDRYIEARPGYGDILTREGFGNYRLHLDYLIPEMPDYVKGKFRGAGGLYISGRYEIQLLDSYGETPSITGNGAIYGAKAPLKNAAKPANTWQSLDVEYRHYKGGLPSISVWLNGEKIHDKTEVLNRTLYGFLEPPGYDGTPLYMSSVKDGMKKYNLNNKNWGIAVRFRTTAGGCLISNAPSEKDWGRHSKGMFVRGDQLVYRIGWRRALYSGSAVNDGKWHNAVLTNHENSVQMYLDGELKGEVENSGPKNIIEHVFRIGESTPTRGALFAGQIDYVKYYNQALDYKDIMNIVKGKELSGKSLALDWNPKNSQTSNAKTVKGPIRLQSDTSKLHFANIWIQPLK